MNRSEHELREFMEDAEGLPYGQAKADAFRAAVRRAEVEGPLDAEIEARLLLVDALIRVTRNTEELNELITAFTRVVALHRRHPELFEDQLLNMLWGQFGRLATAMAQLVPFPPRLVLGICDDMERRCRPDRDDLQTVRTVRLLLARVTGDREAGDLALAALRRSGLPDEYACPACLVRTQVRYLAVTGRDAEAIELAGPILSGELPCDTDVQPADVLHILQVCYLRTGRLEEAREAHRRAYRALDHDDDADVARHLTYFVLTGRTERALALFKRNLPLYEDAPAALDDLELSAAAAMVFGALTDEGRGGERLIWPADPEVPEEEDEEWTFAELRDDFALDVEELAARYDERHGNTYVGDRMRALMDTRPEPAAGASGGLRGGERR